MSILLFLFSLTAVITNGDGLNDEAASKLPESKLQKELEQYSSYHRGGPNRYGEVKSILDQLRRTSSVGAPEAMRKGAPSATLQEQQEDETELSKNGEVSGDLFEGDIVLTVDQAKAILENAKIENGKGPPQRRVKRKVVRDTGARWPGNVIYYTFDRELGNHKLPIIRSAIKVWEDNTCLHFQEGTGRGDYVTFMRGSGCYSQIGRNGGQQGISIGDGCEAVGIAAHEIGHSLGFWHEQNRFDRGNYIRIETQNIYANAQGNFMRISSQMMNDYGVPYDLGSVMHYGSKAFSNTRDYSIRTLDPNYQTTPGQRQRLSFIDVKQINLAYCSGVCQNQLGCLHDGYPDPAGNGAKCNKCRCPLGFGGTLCESVDASDPGCGGVLAASSNWQIMRTSSQVIHCSWLLKAPKNNHVILEVTKINLQCREACSTFLEVKKGPYFAQTGYRFCCQKTWTNPITSTGNEMSVVYRGETSVGNWGIEFRYRTDAPATSTSGGRALADGTWSQWSAWSQCSASCGGCGLKARRRDCAGGTCKGGSPTERRPCGERVCTRGVSTAIDSMCRYTAKVPCPPSDQGRKQNTDQATTQTKRSVIGSPAPVDAEDLPADFQNATTYDPTLDTESLGNGTLPLRSRRRREEATLEPTSCGTKTLYYMCARTSPFYVRLLTPDELKKRVLSSEWNQPRNSNAVSLCCNGFQRQGDLCIRPRQN